MGGGSEQSSEMTPLANTQHKIVKNREELFQDFFLPEFKSIYESISPDSSAGKAEMNLTASEINSSFDAAQKQTGQMLAQRNLSDSGAGVALAARNQRARSSALASAYADRAAKAEDKKISTLAMLGNFLPSATQAAPMESKSTQTQGILPTLL